MVVWLCISKICKLKCFPIIGTWNEMISFSPGENRLESVVGIVCNLMLIMMSVGLDFQFSLSALQVEVKYVTITRWILETHYEMHRWISARKTEGRNIIGKVFWERWVGNWSFRLTFCFAVYLDLIWYFVCSIMIDKEELTFPKIWSMDTCDSNRIFSHLGESISRRMITHYQLDIIYAMDNKQNAGIHHRLINLLISH